MIELNLSSDRTVRQRTWAAVRMGRHLSINVLERLIQISFSDMFVTVLSA
jgi:hypothetical protein